LQHLVLEKSLSGDDNLVVGAGGEDAIILLQRRDALTRLQDVVLVYKQVARRDVLGFFCLVPRVGAADEVYQELRAVKGPGLFIRVEGLRFRV
jgi:hypothetical protein